MHLLLFDIDGTLLLTHNAGREALEEALQAVLGRPCPTDGVAFSGKTDPQIVGEVLALHGLPAADGLREAVLDAYMARLRPKLTPDRVEILPGVTRLLPALAARADVCLGLLTGNMAPMAYAKLAVGGLADYFPFGAFGSDDADRYALPPIALARARAHHGQTFRGHDVVLIGDTEHDLRCGRALGARAVGVCTGRYGRADLLPHAPDLLLDDLADTDRFIAEVLGEA